MTPERSGTGRAPRMTGTQRRQQLLDVGRALFAEKGFEGSSVEEIAARAHVSKPVVYEHFGGKEGLYEAIVDLETATLVEALETALRDHRLHPRVLMEQVALAFLTFIDTHEDGFRILVRDSPSATGTYSSLLVDVAAKVEGILARQLTMRSYPATDATAYAQMLVGMVAFTGQWWLEHRTPSKEEVAARVVNLSWFGLSALEPSPELRGEVPARP